MTARRACPPAPGALEGYAAEFDPLFVSLAQRRGFREYLTGLLQPRDRNKTLTTLAGAEPVAQAQHAAVQQLQYFLSESTWSPEVVNDRRLELLVDQPATAPHARGVLVIDDSGDRKAGHATAHVGRQYLGSVGKVDNGVVIVSTLWADERVYYPLHAVPYTPAGWFPAGSRDADFTTKPQLAADLVEQAVWAEIPFAAVVADCAYGPAETTTLVGALRRAGLPYVLALKPRMGIWARADQPHTPIEAAKAAGWCDAEHPGAWRPVTRTFHDGHTEAWWAVDARLGFWQPDGEIRLVVATTDPATLPERSTWYLVTNRPRPGSPLAATSPLPAADLAEVVRCYGLRTWVEQGYKQVKQELGWADYQVRSDVAIRRHLTLVCCAFSFAWRQWFTPPAPQPSPLTTEPDRRERGTRYPTHDRQHHGAELAEGSPPDPQLAGARHPTFAFLASVVARAPTA